MKSKKWPKKTVLDSTKVKKGVKTAAHIYHPTWREYPPRGWNSTQQLKRSLEDGGTQAWKFPQNSSLREAPAHWSCHRSWLDSFTVPLHSPNGRCKGLYEGIVSGSEKRWQIPPGRGACQSSERLEKSKPESRDFKTSHDLAVRRPSLWSRLTLIPPSEGVFLLGKYNVDTGPVNIWGPFY